MWGGKLPSTWEPIDAEMYAILAYLRKMASASDAQSRRCLVLCDCKPALQQNVAEAAAAEHTKTFAL